MIEHRHTKRVTVSDKVSIYHRGTLVATCEMKDISTDGMAIWTGPLQFNRNTMLEVEINAAAEDSPSRVRLAAMVVYSEEKILGLMFGQVTDTAKQFLRNFIQNALRAGDRGTAVSDNTSMWEPGIKTRRAL